MGRADHKKDKREQDELERLEKENRELKAINRSLLKQIKKLSKGINRQEFEEAMETIEHGPKKDEPNAKKCPECGRLGLKDVIVAGRLFHRCSICDYKSGRINGGGS